jgi:hypothetical protein
MLKHTDLNMNCLVSLLSTKDIHFVAVDVADSDLFDEEDNDDVVEDGDEEDADFEEEEDDDEDDGDDKEVKSEVNEANVGPKAKSYAIRMTNRVNPPSLLRVLRIHSITVEMKKIQLLVLQKTE